MELKLTQTKTTEDRKTEIYEIAKYTVRVTTHNGGYRYIDIREERGEYIPAIYCRTDINGDAVGFEIQTTSYGALPINEMSKMVQALVEATTVAGILTKEFIKED